MAKKIIPNTNGLVFSTDPNFKLKEDETVQETLPSTQQKIRIKLETKHRAGKAVTVLTGFTGNENDLLFRRRLTTSLPGMEHGR